MEIGQWAVEHELWVITDEIYEHLVYGDAEHHSLPVLVPEIADRCVVLNGVAKTYAMTGWRVGWMAGPSDVIAAATNLQSHATSNVCNVAQAAALAAVSGDLEAGGHDARRIRRAAPSASPRCSTPSTDVQCPEPEGAFYAFPNMEGLLGAALRRHRGRTTTLELAAAVLEQAKGGLRAR